MPKRRQIITPGGAEVKDVAAPVIVTTGGTQKVHEDAVTQAPVSVSEEVITGDVDPDATNDGALQAPTLPVEVTSGKLGPNAAYDAKNWGGDIVWAKCLTGTFSGYNSWDGVGEQADDVLIITIYYDDVGYYTTPTFVSESNVNRLFYTYVTNPLGYDIAHFFGMWELTSAFASNTDVEVEVGDGGYHDFTSVALRNFSEYS